MERRNFLKVVGATGALVAVSPSTITGELRADDGRLFQSFEKVQLVDAAGKALKASALTKEENYVFNYPKAGTPSLMVDLGAESEQNVELTSESGEKYVWKGGVGSKKSIVAYSAICAHQLAHPTPEGTALVYCKKGDSGTYADKSGIVCSAHLAYYDANAGCKTSSDSIAPEALASIVLEVAADDTIWATAVLGPDKFKPYFKQKDVKKELKKYYGGKRAAKKDVSGTATTVTMNDFCGKENITIY